MLERNDNIIAWETSRNSKIVNYNFHRRNDVKNENNRSNESQLKQKRSTHWR